MSDWYLGFLCGLVLEWIIYTIFNFYFHYLDRFPNPTDKQEDADEKG